MIFVTTGTQLPFDRLIEAIDQLAASYPEKWFMLQAPKAKYEIKNKNIQLLDHLTPEWFEQHMNDAELMISHAGIGTILSAAIAGKPLIVFPRFGKLKEHRNNHQVATCDAMQKYFPLNVATNAAELKSLVDAHFTASLPLLPRISSYATGDLLTSLKDFIDPKAALSYA